MTIGVMVREMINEAGRLSSESEKILRKNLPKSFVNQVYLNYHASSADDPNNRMKYANEGVSQLLAASASIIRKSWR